MNLNQEADTEQVYLLKVWDRNVLKHTMGLDATVDATLLIYLSQRHQMVLSVESLRLCCASGESRKFYHLDYVRVIFRLGEPKGTRDGNLSSKRTTGKYSKKNKKGFQLFLV